MNLAPLSIRLALAAAFCLAAASQPRAQSAPHPANDPDRQAALALEQAGNATQAEEAWRALSLKQPRNPEPYAHLALLQARQDHYNEAVPLYRKAIALAPNMPALRLDLGLALFKTGQLRDAVTEFTLARKSMPTGSPDADRLDILLGMSHYGLAQYPQAVPFLRQAAARNPQNLPVRLALAHSCLWSKQYPCVLDVYHQILTLNAESAEADMLAAEALDEMNDSNRAITMFRDAVKANPTEPDVHFGLGYLLWKQKQYQDAAAEFQAELANDPRHPQALLYLGDADIQLGKTQDAIPLLAGAIQIDPSLWRAHLDLGILHADAGQNDDALRELQTAEKLNPSEVNVHWRLGRLYRTMGRKDQAKAELDKASSLTKAVDEDLYQKMGHPQARSDNPAATTPPPR